MANLEHNFPVADDGVPFVPEPYTVALMRAMPEAERFKLVQLMVGALGMADDEADLFLAAVAWEMADGDEDYASELYPRGCVNADTWARHKADIGRDVLRQERRLAGYSAMMVPMADVASYGSWVGG